MLAQKNRQGISLSVLIRYASIEAGVDTIALHSGVHQIARALHCSLYKTSQAIAANTNPLLNHNLFRRVFWLGLSKNARINYDIGSDLVLSMYAIYIYLSKALFLRRTNMVANARSISASKDAAIVVPVETEAQEFAAQAFAIALSRVANIISSRSLTRSL